MSFFHFVIICLAENIKVCIIYIVLRRQTSGNLSKVDKLYILCPKYKINYYIEEAMINYLNKI